MHEHSNRIQHLTFGHHQLTRTLVSDDHQLNFGSEVPKLADVARDDGLLRSPCTFDDMGIDYVGCSGSCQ